MGGKGNRATRARGGQEGNLTLREDAERGRWERMLGEDAGRGRWERMSGLLPDGGWPFPPS